jgi:hypothetical protein
MRPASRLGVAPGHTLMIYRSARFRAWPVIRGHENIGLFLIRLTTSMGEKQGAYPLGPWSRGSGAGTSFLTSLTIDRVSGSGAVTELAVR